MTPPLPVANGFDSGDNLSRRHQCELFKVRSIRHRHVLAGHARRRRIEIIERLRHNPRCQFGANAALRPALEPRRYPLSQLNAVARCLGPTAAVLKRFESKPDIVAISGTARSAGEAYTLYNSIRTEPELGLLNWSMVQPNLSDNGTASFEIHGKPR